MIPKPISTRTHGVLDYLTAGTLLALPRAMGWSENVTRLLTGAAVGTIGYSLLTRYELGALKLLPMRAHLALDALSGATLCASPWLLPEEDSGVKQALLGLGLFELGVTALSQAEGPESPGGGAREHDTSQAPGRSAFEPARG
jgi:hypothetical protein